MSQSPIQRGWLCGVLAAAVVSFFLPGKSQSPIQRGWLCGLRAGTDACFGMANVSIPYPAGMALWPTAPTPIPWWAALGLNPLSSGDGFVAVLRLTRHPAEEVSQSPIQRGWLCGGWRYYDAREPILVSIPYPAGMALWHAARDTAARDAESQSPIQRGGLCGTPPARSPRRRPRRSRRSQSPIQRGWLCGDPRDPGALRVWGVSIPYPAGMALWPS